MTSRSAHQHAATSADVARRAGVSQSAVSLVFAGKASGRVSKETEAAIFRAGRELGYRPHRAARTLRLGRSGLLVLAVPDVENPFFVRALRGAEREARRQGYSVTLATVQEKQDWQPVIFDALSSNAVDGFVFFTMKPPNTVNRHALKDKAILVDTSSGGFTSIALDIEAGVRAAMRHLLALGHARIGHLAATAAPSADAGTFNRRRAMYRRCLREAKLPMRSALEAEAPFTICGSQEAALRMLSGPDRPTAVFCDSDALAIGVYKAARALRLRIPDDLAVVGIDDSIVARILEPELTTVSIPAESVGEQSVRLLVNRLRGSRVPVRTTVSLTLIVRGSTGPSTLSRDHPSA